MVFLLTHLLRGVTIQSAEPYGEFSISTHTPLARCDQDIQVATDDTAISTHTPLARCDTEPKKQTKVGKISTHTPLARCDFILLQ